MRIGRGEMISDVAQGRRAEEGVGNRMKRDVGIAVTSESPIVRNLNAAEHNWSIASKCMDIEPGTGAAGRPWKIASARPNRRRR